MAELPLNDQPTLIDTELTDAIIAIQSGTPKQWRKVTPLQLLTLLGYPQDIPTPTPPAPALKGQHIATAAIPAGTYAVRDYVENWVLESGIPAGITVKNYVFNGIVQGVNSRIMVPRVPVSSTQRGWYMELVEDGAVGAVAIVTFGYPDQSYYGAWLTGEATDAVVTFAYSTFVPLHLIESLHLADPNYTISARDNVEVKLYTAN